MREKVPSSTIWTKEIFEGMKQLLLSIFGGSFSPFNVIERKPDEDFNPDVDAVEVTYPYVVLQIPNFKFSVDRWYKKDYYVVDTEGRKVLIDEPPLPYDVHLQMDFYTDNFGDMDLMQIKWLSKFKRDFILDVVNRGGNYDRVLLYPEGMPRRIDEVTGRDRIFRTKFNYLIHAKIEEHDARQIINIPDKVKVITYLLNEGVRNDEKVSNYKHTGRTPDVYSIRRGRKKS